MSFHRKAKLGLAGRSALVSAVAEGMTLKATAAAFSLSPATVHRQPSNVGRSSSPGAPSPKAPVGTG